MAADPSLPAAHILDRVPRQARSRATLHRLVEAAEAVLKREGPDGLTVSAVVEEAGSSVGNFYARFDSREQLIRYVAEVALHRATEGWEAELDRCAAQGQEASQVLDLLLRRLFVAFASAPLRHLRQLQGREDPAPTRLDRFRSRVIADLAGPMGRAESGPADAAWVAARLAVGGAERLTDEDACDLPDDPGLELSRAVRIYLRLRSRKAAAWDAVLAEEAEPLQVSEPAPAPSAPEDDPPPAPPAPEAPEPASPAPVDPDAPKPPVADPPPTPEKPNPDSVFAEKRKKSGAVDPFDVWG